MGKRILTVQDISCVGQCSMAVALPILAACGLEACPLPTAVLSTHTGGFGTPAVVHLDGSLPAIVRHWRSRGITFDAVLVGYLGSVAAVAAVERVLEGCLAPGGLFIADPAMADHGRLYAGLDEGYAQAMGALCRRADILLPNTTEAALLTGKAWREPATLQEAGDLLAGLACPQVVLTGVGRGPEETGFLLRRGEQLLSYSHPRLGGGFPGTGDIFAACFAGLLLAGLDSFDAARGAADFTGRCVAHTLAAPEPGLGVRFQEALPELTAALRRRTENFSAAPTSLFPDSGV